MHTIQYNSETLKVLYPWHLLCGQLVRVYRLMRDAQGEHIFCQLPDETICCLPAWMFSPECTKFTFGAPIVSAAALTELRDLLATLRAAAPCDKSSQEVPKEGNA